MSRHAHLRIVPLDEVPDSPTSFGMVEVGRTENEVIFDCSKDPGSDLPGRLYRRDKVIGGRRVHRTERATGHRKEAIQTEHRFLGEEGT